MKTLLKHLKIITWYQVEQALIKVYETNNDFLSVLDY